MTRTNRLLESVFIESNFDMSDTETRSAFNEADDKNHMILSLTSKLYDKIIDKVDQIDFGTIPLSGGDIKKIDSYDNIIECIDIIDKIIDNYNETHEPIDVIRGAIDNIDMRTKVFQKAYTLNIELPIVLYNTIVLAIVGSVSLMISACIEYIKNPNNESFEVALDKASYYKEKENLLMKNLRRFNSSCSKGEIDAALDAVFEIKSKKIIGTYSLSIVSGIALVGLCFCIVPILQEVVYFYFYMRQSVSDYLDMQASLLDMNYANIQYRNDLTESEKKKIVSKQKKISENFKKISSFFAVKSKDAHKKTKNDIDSSKEVKIKKSDLDSFNNNDDDSDSLF